MSYIDDYCPFCKSYGTVSLYEKGTSLYSELFRCNGCFQIFDEQERLQQEAENRYK